MKLTKPTLLSSIVLLFLLMAFIAWRNGIFAGTHYKYTIGTTTKTYIDRNAKTVFFDYYVNSEKLEGTITLPVVNVKVPGARYYVKYSTRNQYFAELLKNRPVPENIKDAPKDGWNELPE